VVSQPHPLPDVHTGPIAVPATCLVICRPAEPAAFDYFQNTTERSLYFIEKFLAEYLR
jgi:hypothetical protein